MKLNFNIAGIFPTPIYISSNVKEFTKEELDFIDDNEHTTYATDEIPTSNPINQPHNRIKIANKKAATTLSPYKLPNDTFVLDKPVFKELKEILTIHINNYLQQIYIPTSKDLKLYITQSWLNYNYKGGWHHSHVHQNSFLSGVLYFKADKKFDKIFFEQRPAYENIRIHTDKHHEYNSPFWSFDIETGNLIIFPSTTIHCVKKLENDSKRISLSFNTFIKGTLGNQKELTELKL